MMSAINHKYKELSEKASMIAIDDNYHKTMQKLHATLEERRLLCRAYKNEHSFQADEKDYLDYLDKINKDIMKILNIPIHNEAGL